MDQTPKRNRREWWKVKAIFSGRKGNPNGSPSVPAAVRDKLGAVSGDAIVFVEGNTWTAEEAALRGKPYMIVYVEGVQENAPPTFIETVAATVEPLAATVE